MRKLSKRGQLTLFIILAIVIVAGVAGFFIYRNYISGPSASSVAKPVYDYYLSCLEQVTLEGSSILGSRGGYIETPEFEQGSPFMPFSSQLDVMGTPAPYWFYISGNNIVKEQVPSKSFMESELRSYVQENLQWCDFQEFEDRGYIIDVDEGLVEVEIKNNQIDVSVRNELRIAFEDEFFSFNDHSLRVNSNLGRFYEVARQIYEVQKEEKFLENYVLDTITLNVPTTGFEEGCTPMIFNFNEIRNELAESLSENMAAVNVKGSPSSALDEYFVVDAGRGIGENVNFMYSYDWPTKIEIYGEEFIEPVGLQEGLEILGFCFVEYELIYDVGLPVLIQVYDEKELFQVPVVVSIERNQIGSDADIGSYYGSEEIVCKNMNQEVEIQTIDFDGNPVPASVSMSCLEERCYLGETSSSGLFTGIAPSCVNGFLEARAEGYTSSNYLISTTEESKAEILMKKIYDLDLNLGNIQGEALVQFVSDDFSRSVMYPDVKEIQLVEGIYDVTVKVFGDSGLVLPARTETKCFESASGLGGLFGRTENECIEVEIPEQTIDQVLIGGGKSVEFISESTLKEFTGMEIDVPMFGTPSKIEDVGENYIKLEDNFVSIVFRP